MSKWRRVIVLTQMMTLFLRLASVERGSYAVMANAQYNYIGKSAVQDMAIKQFIAQQYFSS